MKTSNMYLIVNTCILNHPVASSLHAAISCADAFKNIDHKLTFSSSARHAAEHAEHGAVVFGRTTWLDTCKTPLCVIGADNKQMHRRHVYVCVR